MRASTGEESLVLPRAQLGTPLCPEPAIDQGDPFLLEVPAVARAGLPFRFYVYVTAVGFPVYGANELLDPASWQRVGDSYPGAGVDRWCWAPCVRYIAGLDRPWVMLYSKADGAGEPAGHQGHRIMRADSTAPAGPFRDSGEILTSELDFAIDPEVCTRADGSTWLLFAADFVTDEPYGTGIVEARINAELRALESAPVVVARPSAPWQVYDPHRSMPWKTIPGVRWDQSQTVAWSTIEGPAALTSPHGREVILYSGGNFSGFYGIGVIAEGPHGQRDDLSPTPEHVLLGPQPDAGLFGPGHCSVLVSSGATYMCYHFRRRESSPRQFAIVPLAWDADTDLPGVALT
jgi:glycosyl hydrolase family 43